jgi:hypothetical protein
MHHGNIIGDLEQRARGLLSIVRRRKHPEPLGWTVKSRDHRHACATLPGSDGPPCAPRGHEAIGKGAVSPIPSSSTVQTIDADSKDL